MVNMYILECERPSKLECTLINVLLPNNAQVSKAAEINVLCW